MKIRWLLSCVFFGCLPAFAVSAQAVSADSALSIIDYSSSKAAPSFQADPLGDKRLLYKSDAYALYLVQSPSGKPFPFYRNQHEFLDFHLSSFARRIDLGGGKEIKEWVAEGETVLYSKGVILGNWTAVTKDDVWRTLQIQAPPSALELVPFEEGQAFRKKQASSKGLLSSANLNKALKSTPRSGSRSVPVVLGERIHSYAIGGSQPFKLKPALGDEILIVHAGGAQVSMRGGKASLVRKGQILRIPSSLSGEVTVTPEDKSGFAALHIVIMN
ncbi:MAG: hypothetical protein AAB036_05360 [Elusimicrobiota bacterium]